MIFFLMLFLDNLPFDHLSISYCNKITNATTVITALNNRSIFKIINVLFSYFFFYIFLVCNITKARFCICSGIYDLSL